MHQWNNDMSLTMVWNYNREHNINMNHLLVTQLSLIEALSVSLFCQTLLPVFSYLLSLTSPKVTFKNLQMYWRFLQRWWLLCLRRMNLNKSPGPVCLVGCVNPVLGTYWSGQCQCVAFAQKLPPGREASCPVHSTGGQCAQWQIPCVLFWIPYTGSLVLPEALLCSFSLQTGYNTYKPLSSQLNRQQRWKWCWKCRI